MPRRTVYLNERRLHSHAGREFAVFFISGFFFISSLFRHSRRSRNDASALLIASAVSGGFRSGIGVLYRIIHFFIHTFHQIKYRT